MGQVRIPKKNIISKLGEHQTYVFSNGQFEYNASDSNLDGYSKITVNVDVTPQLQNKTVHIEENGTYTIRKDYSYFEGLNEVIAEVNVPAPTLGSKEITENGSYYPSDDGLDAYNYVDVNVPEKVLGTKEITENGLYNPADDGYDGYSLISVQVEGGGGGTDYSISKPYKVIVADYDGTDLRVFPADEGDEITLPLQPPVHEGLRFTGWVCGEPIANNKVVVRNQDIVVMPTYVTTSGATEIDYDVNVLDIGSVQIRVYGVSKQNFTVDWGDGTIDTFALSTTYYTISHIYEEVGFYTAKITSDKTYYFNTTSAFGGASTDATSKTHAIKNFRMSDQVSMLGGNTFAYCRALETITFNNTFKYTGTLTYLFRDCYCLKAAVLPTLNGVGTGTTAGAYTFYNCYSLKYGVIGYGTTKLPQDSYYGCYTIQAVTIPSTVTDIGTYCFYNCNCLEKITIPEGCVITNLTYTFGYMGAIRELTIPANTDTAGSNMFNSNRSMSKLVFGGQIAKISSGFAGCSSLKTIDLSNCSYVPELTSTGSFNATNYNCEILVPASLYDEWIQSTNWAASAVQRKIVPVEGK